MAEQKRQRIYSLADIPYERKSAERILTGFSRLDYAIKGLEVGVTLIVGNTNTGKSTLIQGFISNAIKQKMSVCVFAGEHTAESFLQLVYHQNSNPKDYRPINYIDNLGHDTNIQDWFISEEKEKQLKESLAKNIYIYPNKYPRDIDSMTSYMTDCNKQNGTKVFFIDNLISVDNMSNNYFVGQTEITEKIRTFALNNRFIVVLVAHQKKMEQKGFRLDIQDVAGSQNISNKAYNVIVLYRVDMLDKSTKEYTKLQSDVISAGFNISECDGVIECLKTKGNKNDLVGIKYNPTTKTYTQARILTQTEADRINKQIVEQQEISELEQIDDDELNEIFKELKND